MGRTVDAGTAQRYAEARHDIVDEVADGPGRFVAAHGPFERYERTVSLSPRSDGTVRVAQTVDFTLAPHTWRPLLNPAVRRELRRPRAGPTLPWWYPPQRPDAAAATVLGVLATLSLVVGYHGTLLTQTMTFAADEFGASTTAQGAALSAARIGGALAITLGALADRKGRRRLLVASLLLCIGSTVLGAASPTLGVLAATQVVNRGAWLASSLLLGIIAAEEMPAGARAYAFSLLSMTGALGAGVALWLLPIADVGPSAWRVLYLVPLLALPVVVGVGRRLPESRRFRRRRPGATFAGHWDRLALLAGTAFLLSIFAAPQSQFRNEFLREERGMQAAAVSLFVLVTSTPASIGLLVGGRMADTRGRRVVGAVGTVVGVSLLAASFVVQGPAMWLAATAGGIFTAMIVPSLTVYGPELFPTSLRGRANSIISVTAMGGSVVGLTAAGVLTDRLGSFGWALSTLAAAPLLMAVLVLAAYPETAHRELEELNPEDRVPPGDPEPSTDPRADPAAGSAAR